MKTMEPVMINGIQIDALKDTVGAAAKDPGMAQTKWKVMTQWKGGTRSDTRVTSMMFAGKEVRKDFTIRIDEPLELAGTNQYANPQEYLMAALNACMMVGYVALAALEGIELEDVRIETEGEIDLRGFFGLDPKISAGYDQMHYKVTMKGNGTPEQYRKIHDMVTKSSPNRFTIANPVQLESELVIEQ